MFEAILSVFSPEVEVKVLIQGSITPESVYRLQNTIQGWGFKGRFRALSRQMIHLELQGRQANLQAKIAELSHNPLLGPNHQMQVQFLPSKRRFSTFLVG